MSAQSVTSQFSGGGETAERRIIGPVVVTNIKYNIKININIKIDCRRRCKCKKQLEALNKLLYKKKVMNSKGTSLL